MRQVFINKEMRYYYNYKKGEKLKLNFRSFSGKGLRPSPAIKDSSSTVAIVTPWNASQNSAENVIHSFNTLYDQLSQDKDSTPRGLLVPVVHDIDKKSIVQISREIKELSDKARSAKISVDEMQGATITITNMGSIAGEWATPIINPPEVCILGMYRMFDRPVWKNDAFYPEKTMNFSITSDHRLIDGAVAARFIMQFVERVSNPSLILIEN